MRHTVPRIALWSALLALVLLLGGMSSGSASEPSILDWWTNDGATNTAWGSSYNLATPSDLWNLLQPDQAYWSVTTADSGYWQLQVEYAGYSNVNQFGWYKENLLGSSKQVIFNGDNSPGPGLHYNSYSGRYYINFTNASSIGFYLGSGDGNTYTTDATLNPDSYRQVRVFDDPRGASDSAYADAWIMCWEDLGANNTLEYDTAWNHATLSDGTWTGASVDSLNWGGGPEPDYQDMIVSFRLRHMDGSDYDDGGLTPELPSFLLLALSLGAIPVLRRRRRS